MTLPRRRYIFRALSPSLRAPIRLAHIDRTPRVLAHDLPLPQTIALEGDRVYWSDVAAIDSVGKWGGPTLRIATTPNLAVIAVDGSGVYWADATAPAPIQRSGLAGGPAVAITPSQSVAALALACGRLFFRTRDARELRSVPQLGGTPTLVGATPNSAQLVTTIAADGAYVYFLDATRVLRLPRAGGALEVVAADQPFPQGLAVDEANVYWTTQGEGDGDGQINAVPRVCVAD